MIQLKVIQGERSGTEYLARHFPLTIGRSSSNDLQLQAPGVWDRHAEIDLDSEGSFKLTVKNEAMATVNDESIQTADLFNGDKIGLGSLLLQFSLSPITQRSLTSREVLTWAVLALLALSQIVLVYWLPN